ncbi:MAG TPA: hypothetical protein VMH79_13045 [Thermoanaerobaculia bacterium]|nr:hypothetical protein [Thermoanaerobaculia bacterium]
MGSGSKDSRPPFAKRTPAAESLRTEGDCLKLLRRADLPADALQEILGDRNVRKFHAVRRALAAHPRTPRGDALALVATLFWRDLAALSADTRVHPAIRRAADLDLLRRLPEMAVAERVDLARAVGRGALLYLRLDPDPRVLASVLENRFLIEADVIQAATATLGDREPCLCLIAEHPRWGLRRAVRSAILRNPVLPVAVALSLLTRASLEDLRGILESPRTAAIVRACAERVLAERGAAV